MSGPAALGGLLGRDTEIEAIRRFVTQQGEPSSALGLEGAAGIGKTSLWERGIALAREEGLRVLASRASGAETGLAFAALVDLLEDVTDDEIASLPPPQREALEVALYRASPTGPLEPHAIAVGLLSMLRLLGDRGRVLVAIDDIQWLDPASGLAVAYAARRVGPPQATFLLAKRRGHDAPLEAAIPAGSSHWLSVGPTSLGASRQILADRLGLRLPHHTLRRVYDASGGNPFFLLELGRVLVGREASSIVGELPLPDRVEDLVGLRVADLEPSARRTLLALALDSDLRVAELERLTGAAALQQAIDVGVLVADRERVRAAHPLFAAAALQSSSTRERDDVHRALAVVVAEDDRRCLHLALATSDADEQLAGRLAVAGERAASRGATLLAAELGTHALRLTPPDSRQTTSRVLQLGDHLKVAGEKQRLTDLLSGRIDQMPSGAPRAAAYLLLTTGVVRDNDDIRALMERALLEARDDPALRATALAELARNQAAISVADVGFAAERAGEALGASRAGDAAQQRLALGVIAWTSALRGEPVDEWCARYRALDGSPGYLPVGPDRVAAQRMVWRGEIGPARELLGALRSLAEERAEPSSYALVRLHRCELALRTGEWEEAQRLLDEWATTDSELLHWPMYERCRALLAAGRGDPIETRRWAERALQKAEATEGRWDWLEARRALGLTALLEKDGETAVGHLSAVWDHTEREGVLDPGVFPAAADLVEALVNTSDLDRARAVTGRLDELARAQDHPWARAGVLRCEALVRLAGGYDDQVAGRLAAAVAAYEALGLAFEAVRTRLVLGRAQRRARKWGAASETLEAAVTGFATLGSPGWADDARAELDRVGARRPSATGRLTPTERRVAELAAEGLSNKEIARALVVTVNTVEFHLRNTYVKLGIRSRAQLALRLSDEGDVPPEDAS